MNKNDLKLEIGKRITSIRKEKMHMSKVQFANLIGMKNQYLGNVEKGIKGITLEKAIQICNQCDVSADYLLLGITNTIQIRVENLLENYSNDEILKAFEILKNLINLSK